MRPADRFKLLIGLGITVLVAFVAATTFFQDFSTSIAQRDDVDRFIAGDIGEVVVSPDGALEMIFPTSPEFVEGETNELVAEVDEAVFSVQWNTNPPDAEIEIIDLLQFSAATAAAENEMEVVATDIVVDANPPFVDLEASRRKNLLFQRTVVSPKGVYSVSLATRDEEDRPAFLRMAESLAIL